MSVCQYIEKRSIWVPNFLWQTETNKCHSIASSRTGHFSLVCPLAFLSAVQTLLYQLQICKPLNDPCFIHHQHNCCAACALLKQLTDEAKRKLDPLFKSACIYAKWMFSWGWLDKGLASYKCTDIITEGGKVRSRGCRNHEVLVASVNDIRKTNMLFWLCQIIEWKLVNVQRSTAMHCRYTANPLSNGPGY